MESYEINHSLGYIVAKTNWYMKTHFGRLIREAGLNITPEQWAVLHAIHHHPGITQTEIAQASLKDKTNVTRILDVLEKNGHIRRDKDLNDRRAFCIHLTDSGEKALELLVRLADQANAAYCKELNEGEVTQLIRLLNRVCGSTESFDK